MTSIFKRKNCGWNERKGRKGVGFKGWIAKSKTGGEGSQGGREKVETWIGGLRGAARVKGVRERQTESAGLDRSNSCGKDFFFRWEKKREKHVNGLFDSFTREIASMYRIWIHIRFTTSLHCIQFLLLLLFSNIRCLIHYSSILP